eukprot:4886213-Amphidinium_carterae.1
MGIVVAAVRFWCSFFQQLSPQAVNKREFRKSSKADDLAVVEGGGSSCEVSPGLSTMLAFRLAVSALRHLWLSTMGFECSSVAEICWQKGRANDIVQ